MASTVEVDPNSQVGILVAAGRENTDEMDNGTFSAFLHRAPDVVRFPYIAPHEAQASLGDFTVEPGLDPFVPVHKIESRDIVAQVEKLARDVATQKPVSSCDQNVQYLLGGSLKSAEACRRD